MLQKKCLYPKLISMLTKKTIYALKITTTKIKRLKEQQKLTNLDKTYVKAKKKNPATTRKKNTNTFNRKFMLI